jgi:hypothetical protein
MNKENNINNWIKCYLIGPMEAVAKKDGGRGWRTNLSINLKNLVDENSNSIYVFDPTLEESNKTGMESETLHAKIRGWLASGNNDLVKEYATLIWKGKTYLEKTEEGQARLIKIMGDVDYVVNSKFLIARMEKGDSPCGTFFETGIALEHNIPIYVLQTMPRTDYPGSFCHAVFTTNGGFFNSEAELIDFLIKKYNLKVRNNEKNTN